MWEKTKLAVLQHPGYAIVAAVTAAYSFIIFSVCLVQWVGFVACADSFGHLHLALYAPAGMVITVDSLIRLHRRSSSKVPLHYTGIVAILAILLSFVMSQMPSMQHNMAIFCFTAVTVWVSLSLVKPMKVVPCCWFLIVGFLALVAAYTHAPLFQALFLYLCALLTAGVALYKTSLDKFGPYAGVATCALFVVLAICKGVTLVYDRGMPPSGYELLAVIESLSWTSILAGPIMIVTEGLLGIIPIVYLVARMNYRRM